ncbi:MAG TPA: hypothetical protein VLI90_19935, partial [Tepidisphaeraceae bacterium]|nr:hypothetical protein [Tepidisphaeraceae bacterium]
MRRPLRAILITTLLAALAAAAPPASQPLTGDAVLQHLDSTIDWYRRVTAFGQSPVNSQELLLRESARQNARQAVRLALDFGRAEASLLESSQASTTPSSKSGSASRIEQATTRAAGRVTELQDQLAQLDQQIKSAAPDAVEGLKSRRDHLNAQLNLVSAQRDTLNEYSRFVTNASSNGGGDTLLKRIDDLAQSVPEVQEDTADQKAQNTTSSASTASATAAATAAAAAAQPSVHPESSGVFTLISHMFTLSSRMHELKGFTEEAGKLRDHADAFRGPIRNDLVNAVHRGDAIAASTQPVDDPQQLDAEREELNSLTARFKALAAAAVPLGEQSLMFDAARQNLINWRDALEREYARALRTLLIRASALIITILVLIGISELWRRATFRYIEDVRRRRQLMTVRRIVIAVVVFIVIIANVVSEFGSLATFAGLITAGIAVALQTVILSGVAYFFFIGRFGVRVGDRVTINNITGDVVEIGLFRIYLMELSGPKTDPHATGRIVVFSNSVLFQSQAFYKQLPGADYVWHEITFTLAPDTDYKLAEDRLLGAVEAVFSEYRDDIQRQYESVATSLQIQMPPPRPQSRLRFVDAGLEFAVRYPVEMRRASEVDEKITHKLLATIEQEPKLKLVASTTPK